MTNDSAPSDVPADHETPSGTEKLAALQAHKNEMFRAIGRFIVVFELAVAELAALCRVSLEFAGLRQKIAELVLVGLTAEPLRSLGLSLTSELLPPDELRDAVLRDAFNRFQKLTSQRNDIAHGTWFLGWGKETQWTDRNFFKLHRTARGSAHKQRGVSPEEIDKMADEAGVVARLFQLVVMDWWHPGVLAQMVTLTEGHFDLTDAGKVCTLIQHQI